jgi:hypothetical protein
VKLLVVLEFEVPEHEQGVRDACVEILKAIDPPKLPYVPLDGASARIVPEPYASPLARYLDEDS